MVFKAARPRIDFAAKRDEIAMSAKPINLNRVRKARKRDAKRAEADANAVKFGRTRQSKTTERLEQERLDRDLDGKRLK